KPFGTTLGDYPPVIIGSHAQINHSIIGPGCEIYGTVTDSILAPRTVIEENASVNRSVLMDETIVGKGTSITATICDKGVIVGPGVTLGFKTSSKPPANFEAKHLLDCQLTVIGKNARIPKDEIIGTNVIIYPDVDETDFHTKMIADASTISQIGRN
ncbi:glucose-1-phosphate adenylyltransferase, partial [bacterium]|nr:glucose-1-phosphate adenylyltransferase [candidate division CSSED10-310 bacterium]